MKAAKCFLFDLDDTLYYEIDYLKSAYKEISDKIGLEKNLYSEMMHLYHGSKDVFGYLESQGFINKQECLELYRNHFPSIKLNEGAQSILEKIKQKGYALGLITDGRSITQRNKIKALEIDNYFDHIVISEEVGSEKPSRRNYAAFNSEFCDYYYIGDNLSKDFITPNLLGWTTICLLNKGYNIHRQNFSLSQEFLPRYCVKGIKDIEIFI